MKAAQSAPLCRWCAVLLAALDAEAEGDEGPALKDQVYRQKKAKDEQAVDRPFDGDDEAKQQGDDTARNDPAPASRWFRFEAQPDAECAGTKKCRRQKEGQHTGREHRIDEGDDARRRIK